MVSVQAWGYVLDMHNGSEPMVAYMHVHGHTYRHACMARHPTIRMPPPYRRGCTTHIHGRVWSVLQRAFISFLLHMHPRTRCSRGLSSRAAMFANRLIGESDAIAVEVRESAHACVRACIAILLY